MMFEINDKHASKIISGLDASTHVIEESLNAVFERMDEQPDLDLQPGYVFDSVAVLREYEEAVNEINLALLWQGVQAA